MQTTIGTINYFDAEAVSYDKKASANNCKAPITVFNLQSKFVYAREKLLDLGCGTGLSSLPFHKIGMKIWGLDGSQLMLAEFSKKGFAEELAILDLSHKDLELPYTEAFFHHITANGLLHFLADVDMLLRECSRVIKKDGTFSITIRDPDQDDTATQEENKTGVLRYLHKTEQVVDLLEYYGFHVNNLVPFCAYRSPTMNRDIRYIAIVAKRV